MEVISIEEVGLTDISDYVYDLETEDGTYVSGSGLGIVLKNTDSCYVRFDIDKGSYTTEDGHFNEEAFMKEQFRIAQECADEISKHFKEPIHLEFEKIMYPFFLYEKKRYAYQEWLSYKGPSTDLCYKGIAIIRRDYCPYVKEVSSELFEILMRLYKDDPRYNENINIEDAQKIAQDIAVKYVQNAINNLLNDKVPIESLIISKSLKNKYKIDSQDIKWYNGLCKIHRNEKEIGQICNNCDKCEKKNTIKQSFFKQEIKKIEKDKECNDCALNFLQLSQPHVRIAQRLRITDPMTGPKPPDRVPYVIVRPTIIKKDMKQCDITEHPDYLTKKIDTLYYFEHQLQAPITQIFELFGLGPSIYNELVVAKKNLDNNQGSITDFFNKEKDLKKI